MEGRSLTNLESSMVHSAVGILLQFRERDVEQEEEEQVTWVRAMERLELLSVSYNIIFNTQKPPETTNFYRS